MTLGLAARLVYPFLVKTMDVRDSWDLQKQVVVSIYLVSGWKEENCIPFKSKMMKIWRQRRQTVSYMSEDCWRSNIPQAAHWQV